MSYSNALGSWWPQTVLLLCPVAFAELVHWLELYTKVFRSLSGKQMNNGEICEVFVFTLKLLNKVKLMKCLSMSVGILFIRALFCFSVAFVIE